MKAWMNLLVCMAMSTSVMAGDLPSWLEGWSAKGDLRLRLESKDFDDDSDRRDRARYRFRLGAEKKLTENLMVNFRLASGTGEPTSTNDTFDNSFSGKEWRLDQVQLSYKTGDWTFHGGKMKNPLHSSDLVWDTDVNPEGFFQSYSSDAFYVNVGELFLEESSAADQNLYTAQFGTKGGDSVKYDVSATYTTVETADGFLDTGDQPYEFADLYATLEFNGVSLGLDYVKNLGDVATPVDEDNDTAWGLFFEYGEKKPGSWNYALKYAEIERASSLTVFSDSDFGFGDKKGFVGRVAYTASKAVSWQLSVFSVDSIVAVDKGFTLAQLDCAVKF